MKIENTVQLYNTLLEVYTKQVKGLERQHQEAEKNLQQHIGSVPYKVLNARMFIPDAYLLNAYNGGSCYEEKNAVMPALVNFFAGYEKLSTEDKKIFEELIIKDAYQEYLNELLVKCTPFKSFLEAELRQYQMKESDISRKQPYAPQKKNATLQRAKYERDMREYEDKLNSVRKCVKEVQTRLILLDELSSKL